VHGIIFSEMKKYVDTKFGGDTWATLLTSAGLQSNVYLNMQSYPDQEAIAIVMSASKATGKPAFTILEDFGEFIAADLVNMYKTLVRPEWKTLELLENVERTIHVVVRARHPGAVPAQITCTRTSANEVQVTYNSPRKMCPLAKGIIQGVGHHYNQRLSVTETSCVHKGAATCQMSVRVL
jgi:predicted hydrocarbon binding protein